MTTSGTNIEKFQQKIPVALVIPLPNLFLCTHWRIRQFLCSLCDLSCLVPAKIWIKSSSTKKNMFWWFLVFPEVFSSPSFYSRRKSFKSKDKCFNKIWIRIERRIFFQYNGYAVKFLRSRILCKKDFRIFFCRKVKIKINKKVPERLFCIELRENRIS